MVCPFLAAISRGTLPYCMRDNRTVIASGEHCVDQTEREKERDILKDENINKRENPQCTKNAAYKYTKRTCAHIEIMFPDSS